MKFQKKDIFQILFESAGEGLIVVDIQGQIQVINSRIQEMFGYKEAELVGMQMEILLPDALQKGHVSKRSSYNKAPKRRSMGSNMDLSAKRKNGKLFPVEISLNHIGKGKKMLIMALITDITERKSIQNDLEQLNSELELRVKDRTKDLDMAISALKVGNERLQGEIKIRKKAVKEAKLALEKEKELNELKSRFVSMASHEFRTPLSTVLSSVSLVDRYTKPGDEVKRTKHISRIKSSVRNLTSILNDFLSLDKLEQGKIEITQTEFSIIAFSKAIVEEMQAVSKLDQRVKYRHEGKLEEFTTDRQILKNIVINLMSNAIKYSPEGKTIWMNSKLSKSGLVISIEDEGIGIPDKDQKHMFERFFRSKNSMNIQGTGLGLNIVVRYLDMLNGSIKFTSKENKGSTFTITVPQQGN